MRNNLKLNQAGFTLLEILIALMLLVTAMTIIMVTFNTSLQAWRRGTAVADKLEHGDLIVDQLISALRSAAYFPSSASKYGFWLENRSSGPYPNDRLNWVTSGSAFLPEDSPLSRSLHRIVVTVDEDKEGKLGLMANAYSQFADPEKIKTEPWLVTSEIQGINCRIYDQDSESWKDEWKDTNSVPRLLEITIYMAPIEEKGEPVKIMRLVEIPLGALATNVIQASPEQEKTK